MTNKMTTVTDLSLSLWGGPGEGTPPTQSPDRGMAISNRVKQLWIGTMRTHPFARRMRREATLAEQKLWLQLRDCRLAGVKFRRQMPIGPHCRFHLA